MAILILIRGNSASGKTSLAEALRHHWGDRALVIKQDLVRRELLHAGDQPGSPAVSLIETLARFGQHHYDIVIIEGILRRDVYGSMLQRVEATFTHAFVYYLNVPFAQTCRHDAQKAVSFGAAQLHRWWREADTLTPADHLLTESPTAIWANEIIEEVESIE